MMRQRIPREVRKLAHFLLAEAFRDFRGDPEFERVIAQPELLRGNPNLVARLKQRATAVIEAETDAEIAALHTIHPNSVCLWQAKEETNDEAEEERDAAIAATRPRQ